MKRSFLWLFCFIALALWLGSVPASAGTIFSDLGPPGNVYNPNIGWGVTGNGSFGFSFTTADKFTAAIGGNVTQIDLGVGNLIAPPTFYASIWTDNSGLPGTQVADAFWNDLSTSTRVGNCCGLVTISGITGVSLTAGTSYFMILGPVSINDTSYNFWNLNVQGVGVGGDVLYSFDGRATWHLVGGTLSAFDILGGTAPVPEPSAAILMGTALTAMAVGSALRKSS